MATNIAFIDPKSLQALLDVRKIDLRCPICNNPDVSLIDASSGQTGLTLYNPSGKSLLANAVVHTVSLACTNCGYIRQFVRDTLFKASGNDQ